MDRISYHLGPRANEAGGYDRQIREAAQLDIDELSRRTEALTLANVENDEEEVNVDRPWRDLE